MIEVVGRLRKLLLSLVSPRSQFRRSVQWLSITLALLRFKADCCAVLRLVQLLKLIPQIIFGKYYPENLVVKIL